MEAVGSDFYFQFIYSFQEEILRCSVLGLEQIEALSSNILLLLFFVFIFPFLPKD